jgi:hypothetical protein
MSVEERVQIAIDNWTPRFLANGIDPNDLPRVTKISRQEVFGHIPVGLCTNPLAWRVEMR